MELTRAQLENIVNEVTPAIHGLYEIEQVKQLAKQLLAEMDKPKDDVWKNAPKEATGAIVYFFVGELKQNTTACYTRTLPKSPEREIAEKWANTPTPEPTRKYLADTIESAINEYKELVK